MTQLLELNQTELAAFSESANAIAAMREAYMPLAIKGIDDREGFAAVHKARMVVKNKRVEVEKRRKELKADALEYGRKVDSAAKALTELLAPIEAHLDGEEQTVVQEKARIAREAEEAKVRKLQERVQKMVAVEAPLGAAAIAAMSDEEFTASLAQFTEAFNKRKAEAARVAAEEAEAKRQEAIRMAAEREALEAERQRLAEIDRQQKAEADRIAAEQKKIADAEAARLRTEEIERERKSAAEKARIETEVRLKREAEEVKRKAAEAETKRRRAEARRPDREKLLSFAEDVQSMHIPELSAESRDAAAEVRVAITRAANDIREIVAGMAQ